MRINVLQHTPNEGPGTIQEWSQDRGHEMYVYHPYQFGNLPTADETNLLIILGGPMSPNDDLTWIKQERVLIRQLLDMLISQSLAHVMGPSRLLRHSVMP